MHSSNALLDLLALLRSPVLFTVLLAAPCVTVCDRDSAVAPAARIQTELRQFAPNPVVPGRIYGRHGLIGPRAASGFRSELEAVTAASSSFNPESIRDDREFLGGILYDGRQYFYTVSRGHPGGDRLTARIPVPPGHQLVAFWHTHGAPAAEREFFSEIDTALVYDWNRPLYLADYTGALKVYTPGADLLSAGEARGLGLPLRRGYAAGMVVMNGAGEALQVATRTGRQWEISAGVSNSAGWRP